MSTATTTQLEDHRAADAQRQPEPTGSSLLNQATSLSIELADDFLVWTARRRELSRSKPIGRGVILDSQLREPAVVQRYLTDLAIITHDNCRVFLQLSMSDAMLRSFFVPAVPKNELAQVVLWEATKIFPFMLDPNWFSWRAVSTLEWGGVRKYQIQAAAIPMHRIEPIAAILTERFVLDGISLTPLIWEPFLSAQIKRNQLGRDKSVAVVRLCGNRLGVFCYNSGNLEFTRETTLDSAVAGEDFDASLNFLQQAESHDRDPHNYASIDVEALAGLVVEELDYYYGRFSQRLIDRIYLAVSPALCQSTQAALSQALGVKVDFVGDAASTDKPDPQLFAPAERAFDHRHAGIDLTPATYRRQLLEHKVLRLGVAIAALVLFVIIAAVFAQRSEFNTIRSAGFSLEQSLGSVRGSSAYRDLQRMVAHSEHWLTQYSALNHDDWSVAGLLKTLSLVTPAATYLSDLQLQTVVGPDGANRAAVAVTGFVSDATKYPEIQLARYIKALATEPHFTQVMLRNQYVGVSDAGRRLHFTISLEVAQ